MRTIEIGLVLPMGESFVDGTTARWVEIRELAQRAEAIGFDTVWTADELLWRPAEGQTEGQTDGPAEGTAQRPGEGQTEGPVERPAEGPAERPAEGQTEGQTEGTAEGPTQGPTQDPTQGWWECVAMTGALAASTSRVKVGTWILSALHRNPGITAKAVETLDEISGGRFVFGLGSGHAGRQAQTFGLPEDHVFGRFAEAVEIIVPLLRQGRADFEGAFHAARNLEHRPVGPRPGHIPIMIGAKGPKMLRLAALHADIWSWYVEERSDLEEFGPRLAALEAACLEVDRDPATIGRSAGILVEPTSITGSAEVLGTPIRGSAEEIADGFRAFRAGGFTQIEVLLWPPTLGALEAMAPVLELLDAD